MSDSLSSVAGVDLSSSIGIAVARKALDAAKLEGASVVRLIKAAGAAGDGAAPAPTRVYPGETGAGIDVAG